MGAAFTEVECIDWHDGPLLSIVRDVLDGLHLCVVADDREGWWRSFVVVPLPPGATEARAVLREATRAIYWDYGSETAPCPTPLRPESYLGCDVALPSPLPPTPADGPQGEE